MQTWAEWMGSVKVDCVHRKCDMFKCLRNTHESHFEILGCILSFKDISATHKLVVFCTKVQKQMTVIQVNFNIISELYKRIFKKFRSITILSLHKGRE